MELLLAQKTLESLEWPQLVAQVLGYCRTPEARRRLVGGEPIDSGAADDQHKELSNSKLERISDERAGLRLGDACALAELETSLSGVRERLAETSEARELIEAGESPPLHGVADLRDSLRRAEMGGILSVHQLLDVGKTLAALRQLLVYATAHRDRAPLLAALASCIELDPQLERRISDCLDPSGEVRDAASTTLKNARRAAGDLATQLQRRLGSYLRDPNVQPALSDSYFTVRNDRYVLPVRADSRGRVRGIVHDASRSGTTLFIEPEAVVELNNRLKQTELEVAREIERVLRDLSQALSIARPSLETAIVSLATIDLAYARGHCAIEMNAAHPVVERGGCFHLDGLRHPLLPRDEAVPNDIALGEHHTVLVISGPNGGGKTVAMKAVGLAAVMIRLGLHVPAAAGARIDLFDKILVDIGDGQNLRESLSTFSAHMVNLSGIVEAASHHTLALLDEVGVGTDPSEGAALAQSILEALATRGARVIATTHYNLLKEMAEVDERFCNASVEFDPITLAPTFRLHTGTAGVSSATAVAARMGMAPEVLERANALLEREDQQLGQMLSDLANSRATLEREKQEAIRLQSESETARSEYQHKLERLQERRDKLYESMRKDLDATFKDAHAQVAAVIRGLQRAGDPSPKQAARGAAHARERLLSLENRSREQPRDSLPEEPAGPSVDWRRVKPGDSVLLPGGRLGVLKSLPDRRGRVTVQIASAKLDLEAAKVRLPSGAAASDAAPGKRVHFEPAGTDPTQVAPAQGSRECDLRGRRVDEALDELTRALDSGLRNGDEVLLIIHGMGTGVLRSAVREHLSGSPYIVSHRSGVRGEGGEGVTIATLRR